jgi:hypothetical protein
MTDKKNTGFAGFYIEKEVLDLFDSMCKDTGSSRSAELRKFVFSTLQKAGKLPKGYEESFNALNN